ncbi:MAG: ribonuclease H-like domain-containing protein [Halobacteriaceae archaeon]
MRAENSFIAVEGVGEVTERKLWDAGVTHWEEFDGSVVGPTLADRIAAFVADATERLERGDARYFGEQFPDSEHWRLYENFRERACFFDIETTGLDRHANRVTTVSAHQGGETTTLVRGRDLTREALADLLDAPLLVTFNGRKFDAPFLAESFGVELDAPHVDLMYPCRRLGLTGGLKPVERELGIEREDDVDGREAVELWYRYEDGDRDALDRLVRYNRRDAENLRTVMEVVAHRLHRETLGAADG